MSVSTDLPAKLDFRWYSLNFHTRTFDWPDSLVGRTFEMRRSGEDAITVDVDTDTLSFTVPPVDQNNLRQSWQLVETTDADDVVWIGGTIHWGVGFDDSEDNSDVIVTLGDGTPVTVIGSGAVALAAEAAARIAGDAGKQPLDSDLTAIAALTTTSYGRAFLALADAAAGRTALGLGTAATQASTAFDAAGAAAAAQAASQPLDSDLTAIAALTTTSYGRALLALADAAAARTAIDAQQAGTSVLLADAPINVRSAPYSAQLDGSDERAILATAVADAVASGRPLFIPGNMRANTLDSAGPGQIPVSGDLVIYGGGCEISSIVCGPDPATFGVALFEVAAGASLELRDICLIGPVTDTDTTHETFGVTHQGVSGDVLLTRSRIRGFSVGIQAFWPTGSTEGRVDTACGTTSGSAVVTDTSIVTADAGKQVGGPGVPDNTTILSVVNGVSFTMSAVATATATTPLVVGGSALASVGAATVSLTDAEVSGNGGSAVIVMGRGRLHIRRSRIPTWGHAASNQQHGIYVHSGVTVDIDGIEYGSTPGTGWAFHTYHQTGAPDYVEVRNVKGTAYEGILTNPWVRSRFGAVDLACRHGAVYVWGDVEFESGRLSGSVVAGPQIRGFTDSSFPRTASKARFHRVVHTTVAGSYAVDSAVHGSAEWTFTDPVFDTTATAAINPAAGLTFHRARFSNSSAPGVSTTANRPSAAVVGKGATHFDSDLGAMFVSDGSTWTAYLPLAGGTLTGDLTMAAGKSLSLSATGAINFGTNSHLSSNTAESGCTFSVDSGILTFSLLRRDAHAGSGEMGHLSFEGVDDAPASYRGAWIRGWQTSGVHATVAAELRFATKGPSDSDPVDRFKITETGEFLVMQTGSNAAPTFGRTSDATGMWFPGVGQLALTTSGTQRLFCDASGNVGIGTSTSLSDKLTVAGSIGLTSAVAGIKSRAGSDITGDIDFDFLSQTSAAVSLRFFRSTNTSGMTALQVFKGDNSSTLTCQLAGNNNSYVCVGSGSFGINTSTAFGGGVGVLGLHNATTVPTTNPASGGVMYAEAGAGKWRGSSGTITTFGTAEPHCPDCGRDFALEWESEQYGYLAVCMWCLTDQMTKGIMAKVPA